MNEFGLPEDVLSKIVTILQRYPDVTSAKIFGSRSKGNYKRYSDIDIAIFVNTDCDISQDIKEDLEDLDVIYKFDVIHYERTSSTEIKEHIDRIGIEILLSERND